MEFKLTTLLIAIKHPPLKNLCWHQGCCARLCFWRVNRILHLSTAQMQMKTYPYVADMATDHREHLDLVTRTRLFTTRDGHTEYSHRIFCGVPEALIIYRTKSITKDCRSDGCSLLTDGKQTAVWSSSCVASMPGWQRFVIQIGLC